MTKQSRHYCGTCGEKRLFAAEKYSLLLCLLFFPLILVNMTRKPRCQTCGAGYNPYARVAALARRGP
jgi:hypothetical protein